MLHLQMHPALMVVSVRLQYAWSSPLAFADRSAAAEAAPSTSIAEEAEAVPADTKEKKKGRKKKGGKAAANEDDDLDALLAQIEGKHPAAEASTPAAAAVDAADEAADNAEEAGEPETEGKVCVTKCVEFHNLTLP